MMEQEDRKYDSSNLHDALDSIRNADHDVTAESAKWRQWLDDTFDPDGESIDATQVKEWVKRQRQRSPQDREP